MRSLWDVVQIWRKRWHKHRNKKAQDMCHDSKQEDEHEWQQRITHKDQELITDLRQQCFFLFVSFFLTIQVCINDGLQWPPVKWRTDIIIIFGWGNRDIYTGFRCLFITAYFRRPFFLFFLFFLLLFSTFYHLCMKLIYRKIHMNRCIIPCVNTLWEDKRHRHKYLARTVN